MRRAMHSKGVVREGRLAGEYEDTKYGSEAHELTFPRRHDNLPYPSNKSITLMV